MTIENMAAAIQERLGKVVVLSQSCQQKWVTAVATSVVALSRSRQQILEGVVAMPEDQGGAFDATFQAQTLMNLNNIIQYLKMIDGSLTSPDEQNRGSGQFAPSAVEEPK